MKAILIVGTLSLLLSTVTCAKHTMVEDLRDTSRHDYYRTLNFYNDSPALHTMSLPTMRTEPYSEADMLPVVSERLTPGKVLYRATNTPGLAPFFLIGDDELSRSWLRARSSFLREMGAVGLVVNVQRLEALTLLRAIGSGLEMVPASADELASVLNVQHYPLLITATGMEQ
ncbi:integrating conjugative element protein [Pseudomonas synxantha]|uniref:integrating conjugative element protein n=1 Tax=Pseudomonas synxantha TaxID=47883 RepID=UPI0023688CB2|nr:integrating conjugative element protein [Pseudomonas synxantha]WDG40837.1 integrating conjugative element protein [Pseudomonas synxantha]